LKGKTVGQTLKYKVGGILMIALSLFTLNKDAQKGGDAYDCQVKL
jgi:hypothetical protein